jgi:tetratricopeptide (TPR) repeat protein
LLTPDTYNPIPEKYNGFTLTTHLRILRRSYDLKLYSKGFFSFSGIRMMNKIKDLATHNWYEEGCKLTRAGKLSEAVAAFTEAIDRNTGFAEAFLKRGVCYYLLGSSRLAAHDLEAASLLGCQEALLWSRYDILQIDDSLED